jgi:hypothetical protein
MYSKLIAVLQKEIVNPAKHKDKDMILLLTKVLNEKSIIVATTRMIERDALYVNTEKMPAWKQFFELSDLKADNAVFL